MADEESFELIIAATLGVRDKIKGQWKQVAGKVKAKWGKLTDDDLKVAEGNSEYLAGKVQERYGIARGDAEKQVKEFSSGL